MLSNWCGCLVCAAVGPIGIHATACAPHASTWHVHDAWWWWGAVRGGLNVCACCLDHHMRCVLKAVSRCLPKALDAVSRAWGVLLNAAVDSTENDQLWPTTICVVWQHALHSAGQWPWGGNGLPPQTEFGINLLFPVALRGCISSHVCGCGGVKIVLSRSSDMVLLKCGF
jgi:hypothetical protein